MRDADKLQPNMKYLLKIMRYLSKSVVLHSRCLTLSTNEAHVETYS